MDAETSVRLMAGESKMPKLKDLTNQKFERLKVVKDSGQRKNGAVLWECECRCGNITYATGGQLQFGLKKSCGCLKHEAKGHPINDIKDKRFDMLVAKYRLPSNKHGQAMWHCECDCGKTVDVSANQLLYGGKSSCGCSRVSKTMFPGVKSGTTEYNRLYKQMQRTRQKDEGEKKNDGQTV